jgi:hypothetical protein
MVNIPEFFSHTPEEHKRSILDASEDKIKACYYRNKFILVHINSFIKHHAVKAYGEIRVYIRNHGNLLEMRSHLHALAALPIGEKPPEAGRAAEPV